MIENPTTYQLNSPRLLSICLNSVSMIRLSEYSNFKGCFKRFGVRKYGKYRQAGHIISDFVQRTWKFIHEELFYNNSIVRLLNMRIMLTPMRMHLKLNDTLIEQDFRTKIPTLILGITRYYYRTSYKIIRFLNEEDHFKGKTPKFLTLINIVDHMCTVFPTMPRKNVRKFVRIAIRLVAHLVKLNLKPALFWKGSAMVPARYGDVKLKIENKFTPYAISERQLEHKLNKLWADVKRSTKQ